MEPIYPPSSVATTTGAATILQQPHLPGPLYVAKDDYDSNTHESLSFKKGELLYILDNSQGKWWFARLKVSSKEGFVPSNYVERIKSLTEQDWYFGDLKRLEAEKMLLRPINQTGSYLVRESESESGEYTLSVRDSDSVEHYLIFKPDQERFYIDRQKIFISLADLVAHYVKDTDGLCVRLKKPCMMAEIPQTDGMSGHTSDQWEIPHSSIRLLDKVGQGHCSEVFKGLWNDTTQVAVKTLWEGSMSKEAFIEQVHVMKKLRHSNIIQLYAVCTVKEPIYIVTELMKHGSLFGYLHSDGRALKMPQLIDIASQIAAGMTYLQTQHCIHRGLMASNVLIGDSLVAKVAGFGLARVVVEDVYEAHTDSKIPVKWTAPEALIYFKWSMYSDVWSFGVLLTELVTYGLSPYHGMSNSEVSAQIEGGYRMLQPYGCPDRLYDIMLECWKRVDVERPTFESLQWQLREFYSGYGVGGAVKRMGPEQKAFYEQAAKRGVLKIPRVKLDAIGDEDAGKSCLGDSIMDQPFAEGRSSTKGVLMKMALRTAVGLKGKWEEMGKDRFDEELDKLLARGFVNYTSSTSAVLPAPDSSTQEVVGSDKEEATAAHPPPQSTQDGITVRTQATAVALPVAESTHNSADDGCDVTIGRVEFMRILELNESKEAFIQYLQQNLEKLRQYEESTIITLMDRGGQEQYLSIHAALMADSMSNATGYLAVIDITKPLDEKVTVSYYRLRNGEVIKQKHETRTRADTLRHWIAAVEAAHPHDSEVCHQFLGKNHGVKRPPAVFIVITRKDQIRHLGEEFVKRQEQLLCDVICESEHFADHLVPYQKDPCDVLFRVDNTKSGSSDPDPVVVCMKDMIVEMAQSHCSEEEGTPLTYVMLEIGLSKVSQIANNKGKVLELNNVFRLAQQVCDLSPGEDCTTALRYLSNMGAICFYIEEPGLEDKVFPDPQWLADVMSTFVTVLGEANVDVDLWHDLRRLHSEGLMTWKLAEYLLNKAGVDTAVRGAILLVLQLFHIIAPSLQSLEQKEASVKVGHSFLVPCMAIEEYSKSPAAYQSAIMSAEAMPPLFLCPKGFSAFLKPLFYRLITCLVTKYQYRPNIKRHQVILHLPHDLELEILYTTRAVIATLYAVDPDHPPSTEILQQECRVLKEFLVQQLKHAKRRGMDGFKFEVCIHPVGKQLDYKELACIDNYPHDPLVNRRNDRLTRRQCPKLDLWISEDQAEGTEYSVTHVGIGSGDQLYARHIHPYAAMERSKCREYHGTAYGYNANSNHQAQAGASVQATSADRKATAKELVDIASEICGNWDRLALELAPELFRMGKIREIKRDYDTAFLQACAMLEMWNDSLDKKATRHSLIKALCDIGSKAQAVQVFTLEQVDLVVIQ